MKICYVMHPFEGKRENLEKATAWCAFLSQQFNAAFYAPWIPLCTHWDNNGKSLERGFQLDREFIHRSSFLIVVGGRISDGMIREIKIAESFATPWFDASRFRTPNELLADEDAVSWLVRVFGNNEVL